MQTGSVLECVCVWQQHQLIELPCGKMLRKLIGAHQAAEAAAATPTVVAAATGTAFWQ